MSCSGVWPGAGVMVLLVAAINKRNGQTCKGYEVRIDGGKDILFISQAEVVGLLTDNGKEKLSGRTIVSFDLRKNGGPAEKKCLDQGSSVVF